ncbi:uncharacterized protein LOC124158630 [Ischnura elegans]|uniref:uncharacterized protein LOC124158630 n=1 Tax=Ischnura elegans TaxID=197161 RepID=UPI001ED8B2C6|nr:uncharacterized protein LOC124158630 [Ischnura elegans]
MPVIFVVMLHLKIWLARKELKANIETGFVEILKFSCSSDNNHLFLLSTSHDLLHAKLNEDSDEVTFSMLYHNVLDFDCSFLNLYLISTNGRLFKSEYDDVKCYSELECIGGDDVTLRAISSYRSSDKDSLCLLDSSGNLWLRENGKLSLIEFIKDGDVSNVCQIKNNNESDMIITSGSDFCAMLLGMSRVPFEPDNSACLFRISSPRKGTLCLHSESCPCDKPMNALCDEHTGDCKSDHSSNTIDREIMEDKVSAKDFGQQEVSEKLGFHSTVTGKSAVHVGQMLLDTEVWTYGHNRRGQLGVGDQVPRKNGAVCIRQLRHRGVKRLVSGNGHAMALAIDGRAWAWGDDSSGQLGSKLLGGRVDGGACECRSSPKAVGWPPPAWKATLRDVATGDHHSILLSDCGAMIALGKCVSNSTLMTAPPLDVSSKIDDNEEPIQVFASGSFSACVYSSISLRRSFPKLHASTKTWKELLSRCLLLHTELFPLVPSSPLNKGGGTSGSSHSFSQDEFDLAMQAVMEGNRRILALITLTVESLNQYVQCIQLGGESIVDPEHIPPISHCKEFVKVYRSYLEAVCNLMAVEGFSDLGHYSVAGIQRVKSLFPGESDQRIVAAALFAPVSHWRMYVDLVEMLSHLPLEQQASPSSPSSQLPKVSLSVPELTTISSPSGVTPLHVSQSETVSLCSAADARGVVGGTSTSSSSQRSITCGEEDEIASALKAWRSVSKGREWEQARLRAESTRGFWEDSGRGGLVLSKWKPLSGAGRSGGAELCWRPCQPTQRVIRESWVWGGRSRGGGSSPMLHPPSLWVGRPGTLFTSAASASSSPSPSTPSLVLMNDAFLQVAPNGVTTSHALSTLWVQPLRDDSWEQDQIPQNALKMTMPEDSLTVVASTAEERVAWLKAFNLAISNCLRKECPAIVSAPLESPPASRNASHHFQKHPLYKNAIYTGGWLLGAPHGKGSLEWPDGHSIEGVFKDGMVSGHAKHVKPSVGMYEGQWKGGQYHGYGVMRYANGAVYEGEWRNGVPEGHGVRKEGHFLSSVASVYVGDWVAGCKHGYGVMDDILAGQKYLGMWEKDERSGNGLIVSLDGIYHEGTFAKGSITGHGVMVLEEGTHYEGELRGIGVFGGRGCLTIAPGGHRLEGVLSGSWDSGVRVSGGTFHFQRAPTSPSGERPQPISQTSSWTSSRSSFSSIPSSFGKLCVPPSKKWKSLFQLCREELGLTAEEDEEDYVVIGDVKAGGGALGEEAWRRVWENVAVAITRSQLRLKQKLQQRGKEDVQDEEAACETGNSSVRTGRSDTDDDLVTIPRFGRNYLDRKSYEDIQVYLMKATESKHHPLGCLVSSLASAFNATYGGVRVHPLLLPHAVSELTSITARLYAVCRLLFPALPPLNQGVILDLPSPNLLRGEKVEREELAAAAEEDNVGSIEASDEEEGNEEEMVVTSSGLLHPILMPRVHSSLFVLYALHNKAEDDAYWQRLLKWNKHDDLSLLAFLEVHRKFWACGSELSSVPPVHEQSPQHGHSFVEAVETLQQLKTTFCPIEKLQVIRKTFEKMAWSIQVKLGADFQQLGMDDLFPLFNFIVVKAQILQLGSEIHFVEDFMDSHLKHGELGMMFTTLKACYYQILQEKVG